MASWNPPRVPLIFVAASAMTFLTLGSVWLFATRESYLFEFFFNRSWIQYATTFLFWLTIATLASKHLDHLRELAATRRATEILEGSVFGSALIWSHALDVRDRFQAEEDQRFADSVIFRRIIRSLERLHATQSTKSMEDYFRTRSDQEASELDTAYAVIRYCVWLLPTLGFVGTVMGIGQGIAQFAGIIQNASDFATVQQQLPAVTGKLGTAFDTTLLALVFAAIAVFYMSMLLKQEEHVLEQNDRLCSDDICSMFQEHSTESESIIQAIHENVEEISQRMNGNRGALEDLIRSEAPTLVADGVKLSVQAMVEKLTALLQQLSEVAAAQGQMQIVAKDIRKVHVAQIRSNERVDKTLQELHEVLIQLRRDS